MLTKTISGLHKGQGVRVDGWIIRVVRIDPVRKTVDVRCESLDNPSIVDSVSEEKSSEQQSS